MVVNSALAMLAIARLVAVIGCLEVPLTCSYEMHTHQLAKSAILNFFLFCARRLFAIQVI
jgi:hypothetical protein